MKNKFELQDFIKLFCAVIVSNSKYYFHKDLLSSLINKSIEENDYKDLFNWIGDNPLEEFNNALFFMDLDGYVYSSILSDNSKMYISTDYPYEYFINKSIKYYSSMCDFVDQYNELFEDDFTMVEVEKRYRKV